MGPILGSPYFGKLPHKPFPNLTLRTWAPSPSALAPDQSAFYLELVLQGHTVDAAPWNSKPQKWFPKGPKYPYGEYLPKPEGKLLLQKPYFIPYRYFGPFGVWRPLKSIGCWEGHLAFALLLGLSILPSEPRHERLAQRVQDLNNLVLGPKYYNMNGTWDLKHYYLGPWNLGVLDLLVEGAPADEAMCFLTLEGGRWRGRGSSVSV